MTLKRYYPDAGFPVFAHKPGQTIHPDKSLEHQLLEALPTPTPLTDSTYAQNPHYLFGIDLFNTGYYWEAHEAWETIWQIAKSNQDTKAFLWLKLLIKLTAACVKKEVAVNEGVTKHLQGVREEIVHLEQFKQDQFYGVGLETIHEAIAIIESSTDQKPQIQIE